MKSNFGKLNFQDIIRGSVVASLTATLVGMEPFITALSTYGRIPSKDQLSAILISGIGAGLAYVIKNLLTNSNDEIGKAEPSAILPKV